MKIPTMNDDGSDVSPFLTLVIFQLVILVFWVVIGTYYNGNPMCPLNATFSRKQGLIKGLLNTIVSQKTNIAPEKNVWKTILFFKIGPSLGGHVNFQGEIGTYY